MGLPHNPLVVSAEAASIHSGSCLIHAFDDFLNLNNKKHVSHLKHVNAPHASLVFDH